MTLKRSSKSKETDARILTNTEDRTRTKESGSSNGTWLTEHGGKALIGGDDGKEVHPKAHRRQFPPTVKLVEKHDESLPRWEKINIPF